ncbi:MAG: hypothetical protein AAGF68_00325 [Pseudomonadota bacterium]
MVLTSGVGITADPLQRGTFSFSVTTQDPTGTGDGQCDTPAASDDECSHILNSVTVGGATFTTFTPPSGFQAVGFPTTSNIQSRIFNVPGAFQVGDASYGADMTANVFNDSDLNRYQQVDSNANLGFFEFSYASPIPATSDFFFLITERLGNNSQFVEAFDSNGVSMGTVEVTSNSADYTNSGVQVGFGQNAFIALIPLDEYFDASDPTRRVQSFRVTNTPGSNDGGDHKVFVIGNAVPPTAVDDADLDNQPGPVTVDILANDLPTGTLVGSTVELVGSAGPGQPVVVPGQGTWSVDTTTGEVTFTPEATFADDPDPIGYTVEDGGGLTTNQATITITYLIDPEITLVKTITSVADTNTANPLGGEGDTITYSLTATNTGNVSLADVAITDALLGLTDALVTPDDLAPGASGTLTDTYVIQAGDVTAGEVENTATASGTPVATTAGGAADPANALVDINGDPLADVTDTSDTGSESAINGGTPVTIANPETVDSDGTGALDDDPTVLVLPVGLAPEITLVKAITSVTNTSVPAGILGDAGDTINYTLTVTNTGNTSLADITVTDALLGLSNAPVTPDDLAPGGTATITGSYVIQASDVTAGQVDNTASTTGTPVATTAGGAPDPSTPLGLGDVSDTSDTATEPEINGGTPVLITDPAATDSDGTPGNDGDEPTVLNLGAPNAEITLVKTITDVADTNTANPLGGEGDTVTYSFTVTNTGNTSLASISIEDANLSPTTTPVPTNLLPGASTTVTRTYLITAADVTAGRIDNTATVTGTPVNNDAGGAPDPSSPLGIGDVTDTSDTGSETAINGGTPVTIADPAATDSDGTPGNDSDEPTVLVLGAAVPPTDLTLTKTTPDSIITRGQLVPYTIRLQNNTGAAFGPVDIVDTLPTGFVFVPGTAQLDGVDVVPVVTDSTVTITGVASPAGSERVVTLTLRALTGTNPGTYVNTALALDPVLGLSLGPATAAVRILPEAVFDCGEVVGRVFNDLDADGYQDSFEPGVNPAELTDQTYYGDKFEAPEIDPEERGLPGVRLVTLDGLVITTDDNGLFSVPCAALPADRGSNFLLSLDERTLPLGFSMTTENPRVMRLTPGMLIEMNFGARLEDQVRIDLNAHAFGQGSALSAELRQGLASLADYLAENPSGVALSYHVAAGADAQTVAAGRARMERVEDALREIWRDRGGGVFGLGRLDVEQSIVRAAN